MERVYTAVVTAKGGRDGHIKSDDGILDLGLKRPKEMDGEGGHTNPEQLFAGAYGACYLGALGAVAKKDNVDVSDATAEVHIGFNKSGNSYVLSADIRLHIPNHSLEDAQHLAEKAHRACPYSKAVKGNIEVKIEAV